MDSRQYLFNSSTLTVKFGNILDTKAEIIVSSDDCDITMGGGVSGAILRAGGDTIIKDAQKMCPASLGDVVVTTAGKMERQLYVYHCITIDKKRRLQIHARQVTEEDVLNYLLQHAVDKCFQLMSAMDLTSIAFPAITTSKDIPLPTRSAMKHQVFISYSRKDQKTADYLCTFLKENGIEYWIDKEGIFSSSNYKELIVDAIEVSQAVIFISSINSNSSINIIREIGYAVNMNKPILPLVLDDAQYAKSIRLDISDIDKIDFKNPVNACKKLITSLMYVVNK